MVRFNRNFKLRGDHEKRNKFNRTRVNVGGVWLDSKREANRYGELLVLARLGEIRDLKVHPRWPAVVNGVKICRFITADFSYIDVASGAFVVEDAKSEPVRQTRDYQMRKKLLLALHGIDVKEI